VYEIYDRLAAQQDLAAADHDADGGSGAKDITIGSQLLRTIVRAPDRPRC
jgi:hypothetical protein